MPAMPRRREKPEPSLRHIAVVFILIMGMLWAIQSGLWSRLWQRTAAPAIQSWMEDTRKGVTEAATPKPQGDVPQGN